MVDSFDVVVYHGGVVEKDVETFRVAKESWARAASGFRKDPGISVSENGDTP